MLGRTIALAALVALLATAAASAAPVTVNVRVEGSAGTVFEGPVTTDAKQIDMGDGPHRCDGTNGAINPAPGPTMFGALDDAGVPGGWAGTWNVGFDDFFLDRIGADANDFAGGRFWGYALDLAVIDIGGCQQQVQSGDEVLFAYDLFNKAHLLKLSTPAAVTAGRAATLHVADGKNSADTAVDGATIAGAPQELVSDANGNATATFDSPGIKLVRATKAGSVPSATVSLCVSGPGFECAPAATEGAVRDSSAPRATISGLRDGQRLRRGPRILHGTAADDTAVSEVKLALRRHHRGKPCQWWSARREKFVGTSCDKRFFFRVGSDRSWSYQLPARLPAGRYVLDVKAFDRARNRDEHFVRGQNRIVFYVKPRPASRRQAKGAARRGPGAAASGARGASVRVMVIGRAGTLAAARSVRARATRVSAHGRRCRVGAGTPLAALTAVLRGRVSFALRDYGRCSPTSAASSGQLFVRRVGREVNRGDDGWFYKIDGHAGTAGAADPAGPFGRGALRRGARVVWFYCLFDDRAASCQRSLRVEAPATAPAGAPVPVRVTGADNEGRARPVAGARVSLGAASAVTDGGGRCSLIAPGAGRWSIRAEHDGMVPAFPERIAVT